MINTFFGLDLSSRESEVLAAAARGDTVERTAHLLGISPKTVKSHRGNILVKLGATNMSNAVFIGTRKGLIEV